MAQVSDFSTAANFKTLTEALAQIDKAISEAKIAEQAGIPGASDALKTAEASKQRIKQVYDTYFPEGTAPAA